MQMSGYEKMSKGWEFSQWLKWSVGVIGFVSLSFLGINYFRHFGSSKNQSQEVLHVLSNSQHTPQEPDRVHLNTIAMPVAIRNHLLDGNFRTVNRVDEITENCKMVFDSSFMDSTGSVPKRADVELANPAEPFQASDNITSGLPFRRLVLMGIGSRICFVYYERGGAMYPSTCLAVIDYSQKKTIWVGESVDKARSLSELRLMLSRQQFRDSAGPIC
jgi:hypothetical protein